MRPREPRLSAFGEAPPADAAPHAPPPGPAPDAPPARGVSEVVAHVKRLFAGDPGLNNVWVRGEISKITFHSSGHWYLTLKDAGAVLDAAMFRGANGRVKFRPEEGMEVLARGRVDVYPASSRVQLIVEELRPVGAGELAVRFEQLKRKLEAQGLFDPARKVPLPFYPRTVGIVTSLHAAALRDMVRVATERNPAVSLLVAGAKVQGEGAAAEIAAAIARLDADGRADVIIVGRGGGSVEDLWAFNEEIVVRAVAACRTPIVSAVGHETDVTLCDHAADHRAATPSNAAETVVPDAEALLDALDAADERMATALDRLVPELAQRLDDLLARARTAARRQVDRDRALLQAQAARLDALSPLAVLARGYAVVQQEGRLVRLVDDAREDAPLRVRLQDGHLEATITKKQKEES